LFQTLASFYSINGKVDFCKAKPTSGHGFSSLNITVSPLGQCYKTFFVRDLQIFVKGWSVRPQQAFPAYSNKHSRFVRKFVNYGRKRIYNIGPRNLTLALLLQKKMNVAALALTSGMAQKQIGSFLFMKDCGVLLHYLTQICLKGLANMEKCTHEFFSFLFVFV
jgi:hypothetical protein